MSKAAHEICIFRSSGFTPEIKDGVRQLPTSLLILPWGDLDTNQGKVICNDTTLAVLMANQRAAKFDRVALDFNHNTVEGAPAYQGDPAKVACFGAPRIDRGKGIFLDIDPASWTPEGKEHVLGGHYPELSAAVRRNDKGEVTFLHSGALVRQGEVKGLTVFSVNLDSNTSIMDSLNNLDPASVRTTANVFLNALGVASIPDDAQPDAVLSALTGGLDKITTLTKPATQSTTTTTTLAANPGAAAGGDKDVKDSIIALNARLDNQERQRLVDLASSQGKVIPLTDAQVKETPIATLSAMIEKLPITVPLDKKTPDAVLAARTGGRLTSDEQAFCRTMGITEEAYRKHNPVV